MFVFSISICFCSHKPAPAGKKPATSRADTRIPRRQPERPHTGGSLQQVQTNKRPSPEGGVPSSNGGLARAKPLPAAKSTPLTQYNVTSLSTGSDGDNPSASTSNEQSTTWGNAHVDPYDSLADASSAIGSEAEEAGKTPSSIAMGGKKTNSPDTVQRLATQYRNALAVAPSDRTPSPHSMPGDSGFSSTLHNITQNSTGSLYAASPAVSPIPSPRSTSPVHTATIRLMPSTGASPNQSPYSSPILARRSMPHATSDSSAVLDLPSVPDTAVPLTAIGLRSRKPAMSSSLTILQAEKVRYGKSVFFSLFFEKEED